MQINTSNTLLPQYLPPSVAFIILVVPFHLRLRSNGAALYVPLVSLSSLYLPTAPASLCLCSCECGAFHFWVSPRLFVVSFGVDHLPNMWVAVVFFFGCFF